jgi:hypothetical protein
MRHSGRYFEALAGTELKARAVDLEHGLTLQDVKELPGLRMKMPTFAIPGRHALLNDTQFRAIEQMPPFAPRPPLIPFARCDVDDSQQDAPNVPANGLPITRVGVDALAATPSSGSSACCRPHRRN